MGHSSIRVRVPASTSNLGAGFDCLGMALSLWLDITLEPGGGFSYRGTLADLDAGTDLVAVGLRSEGLIEGYRLTATSQIPISRGLGSSAAARTALAVLQRVLRGDRVDRYAVFEQVADTEGHPDNAAPASLGGAILCVPDPKGNLHVTRLPIQEGVGVALAIPDRAVETAAARDRLPRTVGWRRAVTQAARAAALVRGLETGDGRLIASGMEDVIAVPARADLIPGLEAAGTAGRDAGAWGVTISGSGSAVIALAPRKRCHAVAAAMAAALTDAGNPATATNPAITDRGFDVQSA